MRIRSYEEARSYWKRPYRRGQRRKLQNNTYLERGPGGEYYGIRLHRTLVVIFHRSGKVRLSSGGWKTPTTSSRIHNHMPDGWHVSSHRGTWYLVHNTSLIARQEWAFDDGITFFPSGRVRGNGVDRRKIDWDKRVKAYCRMYMRKLMEGKLTQVEGCWDCSQWRRTMKTSASHLAEHVRRRKYPAELVRSAIAMFGEPQDEWTLATSFAKNKHGTLPVKADWQRIQSCLMKCVTGKEAIRGVQPVPGEDMGRQDDGSSWSPIAHTG